MKRLLFAPLFLDEGERLQRNIKWIDYIFSIKQHLEFDEILFVDNASSDNLNIFESHIKKYNFPITIIKCDVRMSRRTSHAYSYWYRAFAKGIKYAMDNNYDALVHIDTDVYLLNNKMTDWVNSQNTGWVCQYCSMYNYPETTFQIICKDQYEKAYKWFIEDFLEFYPYAIAETKIPFTHIEKSFNGDRWGEKQLQQTKEMDWFGQCPVDTEMKFNEH